jgi:phytanoyl-CoA hydroxylase
MYQPRTPQQAKSAQADETPRGSVAAEPAARFAGMDAPPSQAAVPPDVVRGSSRGAVAGLASRVWGNPKVPDSGWLCYIVPGGLPLGFPRDPGYTHHMTASDDLRRQFDRDGFVIVRQMLTPQELAELCGHLDWYTRQVVPGLPDSDAFYLDRSRPETLKQMQHMVPHDAYFREYAQHPKWLGLGAALLGEPVESMGPEWFNKPPGTESPTPPHQDNYYFCLKPPQVLTIWLALDVVDDENGCLRYVAGSHRHGIRPHARSHVLGFSQGITDYGPADRAGEVRVQLDPGDAVAHHGETIHRADPNRSTTRQRRAFAMVIRGTSGRRDDAAFARYQASLRAQHQELGLKTA